MMKTCAKKLLTVLIGLSLLAAPLLCCCFTMEEAQAVVVDAHSCCPPEVQKTESTKKEQSADCDCGEILSTLTSKTQILKADQPIVSILDINETFIKTLAFDTHTSNINETLDKPHESLLYYKHSQLLL